MVIAVVMPSAERVSGTTDDFSLHPNTRVTPGMASISSRLSWALHPVTITAAPGLMRWTLRIRLRDLASAIAVTEQVLTR